MYYDIRYTVYTVIICIRLVYSVLYCIYYIIYSSTTLERTESIFYFSYTNGRIRIYRVYTIYRVYRVKHYRVPAYILI